MIIDLFAGPGGWSEGLRQLSPELHTQEIGIEWDEQACLTRAAAGHRTIRADIAAYPTEQFARKVTGLIASPPCTDFSMAGGRKGLDGDSGHLVRQVMRWAVHLEPEWIACEQVPPVLPIWLDYAAALRAHGYSTWAGVLNAADYGVPQTRKRAFLLASKVRPALPPEPTHAKDPEPSLFGPELRPWVSMARALGWDCARRVGFPRLDDRGDSPDGYRERDWRDADEPSFALTEKARSWVVRTGNNSMVTGRTGSKAGDGDVQAYERSIDEPAPTLDCKAGNAWKVVESVNTGLDWKKGGTREDAQTIPTTQPAPTLTATAGTQWHLNPGRTDTQPNRRTYPLDEPAPTVAFGHDAANWAWERPATTIAGDSRCWPPGHKINADDRARLGTEEAAERYGDRAGTDAIRLQAAEALILQSFPHDYPVQGTKTKQFEQIGNAVPPRLAAHVIAAITGLTYEPDA